MKSLDLETLADAVARALDGPCRLGEGTPVVAACSGGADSVALVAALKRVDSRWPLAAVAFVDHGLRDVGRERAAAIQAAADAGVPFRERRLRLGEGGNRQAEARRARYEALLDLAGDEAVVATGHTRTDQAETVLQRLIRGAGLRGLGAVRPREGAIVRPLLEVSRDATRGLGLPFADDPTNDTDAYQRNRLRRDVFPLLLAENPRAEEALARVATQARDELELIDTLMDRIDTEQPDLRGADPAMAEAWTRWRLRREQAGSPPSRQAVAQLATHLLSGSRDAAVSLGGGRRGRARSGRLSLSDDPDPRKMLVAPAPGTYRLADVTMVIEQLPRPEGTSRPIDSQETIWLDPSRVLWPLRLRAEVDPSERTTGAAPRRSWVLTDGAGHRLWRSGQSPPRPPSTAQGGLRVRLRPRPRVVP